MSDRIYKVSKYLSKYLRHSPKDIGLTLQPGGWVEIEELLKATDLHNFPITKDELKKCVETNDKKRFSFDESGLLIRANQGHSVEVDLQLKEKVPPQFLYHGTAERFLDSIMKHGINKRNRHHVHLSANIEVAEKVGSRHGTPVVLLVRAKVMYDNKHRFYQSDNGVWLVEYVPVHFIEIT